MQFCVHTQICIVNKKGVSKTSKTSLKQDKNLDKNLYCFTRVNISILQSLKANALQYLFLKAIWLVNASM